MINSNTCYVKQSILKVIHKLTDGNGQTFAIWSIHNDTTSILIARRDKGLEMEFLISNSNRSLELQKLEIPVIMQSDLYLVLKEKKKFVGYLSDLLM